MSRTGIVLTLVTRSNEGHLAYRSQSEPPRGRGTTLGGRTDDPRGKGTRTAAACHPARRAVGQCQPACREAGISRALFYRWRQRLERYGSDGVHPRRHRGRAGRPVQLAPETERLLLSVAVSAATWGARRIAAYLQHRWQLRVAPTTVQRALRRTGLATRRQRLLVLEQRAVQTAGLLTARTRRAMWPRASRASWCAWTPSTSASSRGWARSGRSQPAMRPARTGWPGCCPPTPPRPRPTSCAGSCSRSIAAPAGGCAASSPTAAPSSREPSMRPV